MGDIRLKILELNKAHFYLKFSSWVFHYSNEKWAKTYTAKRNFQKWTTVSHSSRNFCWKNVFLKRNDSRLKPGSTQRKDNTGNDEVKYKIIKILTNLNFLFSKVETGGSESQSHPWLHSRSEDILGYMIPRLKKTDKQNYLMNH